MAVFKKGGYLIILERDISEPEELFLERGYFVAAQEPKNKQEYNKFVVYSRIFINNKYKKNIYNQEIMVELANMMANLG